MSFPVCYYFRCLLSSFKWTLPTSLPPLYNSLFPSLAVCSFGVRCVSFLMFFSSFFLRMFFSSVFLLPRRRQTGVPKETLLTISQPKHCDAELKKKKLFLSHELKDACNLYMRRVCRLCVRAQVCVSAYDLKFPTTCAHTFYICVCAHVLRNLGESCC